MSVDLMGLLKLVHEVSGFLVRLSPQQLTGIADGSVSLKVDLAPSVPAPRREPERSVVREPTAQGLDAIGTAPLADFAEIAGTLREHESIDDGLAYLDRVKIGGKKLAKADLLAVAKELRLTLPASITVANAKRKLLEHAIGARKKYAGLVP